MKNMTRFASAALLFFLCVGLVISHPQKAHAFNLFQSIQNLFSKQSTTNTTNTQSTQNSSSTSTGGSTGTSAKATTTAAVTFRYTKPNFSLKVTGVKKASYTLEYTRTAKGMTYQEGLQGGGKANTANIYSKSIYGGTQSSKYFIPHVITGGKITVVMTKLDGSTLTYTATFTITKNKFVVTSQSYQ
jgi:hypothetical protein